MKARFYFLKTIFAGIIAVSLLSCGQEKDADQIGTHFSALKPYQAAQTSFKLSAQLPGNGDISIYLSNDNKEHVETFMAIAGSLNVEVTEVNANEVYFLSVSGMNEKTGYWMQEVPLFVTDGAEFELVADTESANTGEPHVLKVEGGGEEQDFLEEWHSAAYNQVISLNEAGDQLGEIKNFNQEYIDKKQSLISTFYLISKERNHRAHMEAYTDFYLQSPAEVQNSKYGVDFANHMHRITHAATKIDFSEILTARSSRLLPFQPETFADKEYLVLYIWASWEPKAVAQLETVAQVVGGNDRAVLLYFSLDTRMSDWKPLTDNMELENSYMVRAETRQASIDQLYLTELPRIMIVKPDGQIVEQDLNVEQLDEVLAAL